VLGHAFTFEQVCQVAGIGEQEGLVTLDELLVSQYLSESKDLEREAYFFTHDKIRDVAYTEAGEARRRVFPRRALDVLAAAAAPPAEPAHHARASGLSEPTFHWSLAAGDTALRLFAVRDAIVHYEQARSLLTEPQGRRTLRASAIEHLYLQVGRAYELNSEFEQAYAVYEERSILHRATRSRLMVLSNRLPPSCGNSLTLLAIKSRGQTFFRHRTSGMCWKHEWLLAAQYRYRWRTDLASRGDQAILPSIDTRQPLLSVSRFPSIE